jgi:hypothetical protein
MFLSQAIAIIGWATVSRCAPPAARPWEGRGPGRSISVP